MFESTFLGILIVCASIGAIAFVIAAITEPESSTLRKRVREGLKAFTGTFIVCVLFFCAFYGMALIV